MYHIMGEADFQSLVLFSLIFILCLLLLLVRCVCLLRRNGVYPTSKRSKPCRTAVVVGSGGHTSEMMRIVGGLNLKAYTPRLYVIAKGDEISQEKVRHFESSKGMFGTPAVVVKTVPRARQVLQSYFTSFFTTLAATMSSFSLIFSFRPDLVLCNGPGTCIPICFWAYLLKFFFLKETKIIYVESLCRVQKLSLSGLILYYFYIADYVFVQWPRLQELYPRTRFIGRVL